MEKLLNQPIHKNLYNLFISPAAFQLWFLRDLFMMLMFSPLLWWIAKRRYTVALIIAILSTIVYPWLIYFWIGIIIAVQKWDIENYPRPKWIIVTGTVLFLGYAVFFAFENKSIHWLEILVNLIGLYIVWSFYDIIVHGRCLSHKGLWKYICGYSFFIYCFHEPVFNIIKKLALFICGTSEPVLIFFYYLNPLIMIAVAIYIAKLLQCNTPRLYKLLTGGR